MNAATCLHSLVSGLDRVPFGNIQTDTCSMSVITFPPPKVVKTQKCLEMESPTICDRLEARWSFFSSFIISPFCFLPLELPAGGGERRPVRWTLQRRRLTASMRHPNGAGSVLTRQHTTHGIVAFTPAQLTPIIRPWHQYTQQHHSCVCVCVFAFTRAVVCHRIGCSCSTRVLRCCHSSYMFWIYFLVPGAS